MRYNVLKSCATRVCCACGNLTACVAEWHLTLRTGCERYGRKNPLPYPISERSHVGNLRRANKQGKGRSSKRKENRRLSFLFAPAAGRGTFPPQRRRIPPLRFSGKLPARKGRTRLRQFECPAGSVQKRSRPLGANTLTQFAHPGFPVQKRSRPVRANPLTQFEHPGQPVQERSRTGRANPPATVRVPRSTSAGKRRVPPR